MQIIFSKYEQNDIKKEKSRMLSEKQNTFYYEKLKVLLIKITFGVMLFLAGIPFIKATIPFDKVASKVTKIHIGVSAGYFFNVLILFFYYAVIGLVFIGVLDTLYYIEQYAISHIGTFSKKLEKLNEMEELLALQNAIKTLIKTDKACFIFDETVKELKITVERNDCAIKIDITDKIFFQGRKGLMNLYE